MGWFKRSSGDAAPKRSAAGFWREPPFRSIYPGVMYQGGISAVGQGDGPGMMKVGWALWGTTGLHQHQAADFLRDGLSAWRKSGSCDPATELAFLNDCFERVQDPGPPCPPNIYEVPPEVVAPASEHQGMRCYVASELIEVLGRDDPAELDRREPELYAAIASSRPEFVPPRSTNWARAYAANHGLPDPWGQ